MSGRRHADPVEAVITAALKRAGIAYRRNVWPWPAETERRLDFYLPDLDLYIEVTRMHTPRKIEQLKGLENVLLIQGLPAARAFIALLERCGATNENPLATPAGHAYPFQEE